MSFAPMGFDDEFTFGKHEGELLSDVIDDDPRYLVWLREEKGFRFDGDANGAIDMAMKQLNDDEIYNGGSQ